MNTKPAIYLTDPAEMLKLRLNMPRQSSEQARLQREHLAHVAEATVADAKAAISSRGRVMQDA